MVLLVVFLFFFVFSWRFIYQNERISIKSCAKFGVCSLYFTTNSVCARIIWINYDFQPTTWNDTLNFWFGVSIFQWFSFEFHWIDFWVFIVVNDSWPKFVGLLFEIDEKKREKNICLIKNRLSLEFIGLFEKLPIGQCVNFNQRLIVICVPNIDKSSYGMLCC